MERSVRAATTSSVRVEGTPGDRGIFVGVGGPEEVYGINGEKLTKEEWL